MPHAEIDLDDLPLDKPVRVDRGNGIVVIRRSGGVTAFEDVCPHAQWRLSDGEMCDGVLECPGHGWHFDAGSGQCLTVPAYRLKPCAVTVVDNRVRIESPEMVDRPESEATA